MAFRRRLQRRRKQSVYYGENVEDGSYIPPLAPFMPIDDVTGQPIPNGCLGFQDGLIKDVRDSAGSWENAWRNDPYNYYTYDPALGVQIKPAGYGKGSPEYNG